MSRFRQGVTPSSAAPSRLGVLLVNTGTPDAPDRRAVRRFLAEMLADPRLVELPRWLWLPVLHGVILRLRPRRSAQAYASIWTPEGSPQLVYAHQLAAALQAGLEDQGLPAAVELGMNYGNPSIAAALDRLRLAGCTRLLVLPLFPQYAAVVTGSVFDRVAAELSRWRSLPELRFVRDYHDAPAYIEALRQSVAAHFAAQGQPDHLLMSFHSMPRDFVERGDPYEAQVQQSSGLLAAALGLAPGQWSVSFQSRFGFQEWLRPYTVDAVAGLARAGVGRLAVVCPGFAVDCLESLEEIAMELPGKFLGHGGETLEYIPALNDGAAHVDCLSGLVCRHAAGWSAGEVAAQGGRQGHGRGLPLRLVRP
jgi:ferrochelatase